MCNEQFRSSIPPCRHIFSQLRVAVQYFSTAEITHFKYIIFAEQHILWLNVSMNDAPIVHMRTRTNHLVNQFPRFVWFNLFILLDFFQHCPIQLFKDEARPRLILYNFNKLDDVVMRLKNIQDLYFTRHCLIQLHRSQKKPAKIKHQTHWYNSNWKLTYVLSSWNCSFIILIA